MSVAANRKLQTVFRLEEDGSAIVMNALGQCFIVESKRTMKVVTYKNDPNATVAQLGEPDTGKVWKWYEGRILKSGARGKGYWRQVKAPVVKVLKDGYEWKEYQCKRTLKDGTVKHYTQRRQVKIKVPKERKASLKLTKQQMARAFGIVRGSSRFSRPDDMVLAAFGMAA